MSGIISYPEKFLLLHGKAQERLKEFPDNTFHTVITSPPYWKQRDYFSTDQLGQEATPEEFVANLVSICREVKRVLREKGRLGVISMSKGNGESRALRLYEWVHQKWPKYVDCRPIYLEQSLRDAGYEIREKEKLKLLRLLPLEIVVAVNGR